MPQAQTGNYNKFQPMVEEKLSIGEDMAVGKTITGDNEFSQADKRFLELIEWFPGGILITIDERIVFANNVAMGILGFSNFTDLTNKKIIDFIYDDALRLSWTILRSQENNVQPELKEMKIIALDGRIKMIEFVAKSTIYDGKDAKLIVIQDITEKRKTANLSQRILDYSPVSIIVVNSNGEMIAANNKARIMMGKQEAEIDGCKLHDTDAINRNHEVKSLFEKLLSDGTPFFYNNLPYYPKNSPEEFYLNIIAVPLFDEGGRLDGALSMAIDNTEAVVAKNNLEIINRHLEEKVKDRTAELDTMNRQLKKVLKLKTIFIADASHELRTPLTVIQGNLDLAKLEIKQGGACNFSDTLSIVCDEVEYMARIISDLTLLTNADRENEQMKYEKIDLDSIIKAALISLKLLADEKQVDFQYTGHNLQLVGDETKLEKLFMNIIRNAIKYNKNGGWVKITTAIEKDQIKIAIADNGIGINEEDLPNIFERFYRSKEARGSGENGSGLGLAIAKWVVDMHGGEIKVESRVNVGTIFIIKLPLDPLITKK